jgi:hypothetical protein
MDRAILLRHLEQAERHIADGQRQIARQREIVAEFEGRGVDSNHARSSLALFEEMQALHVASRDRVVEMLQNADWWAQQRQFE